MPEEIELKLYPCDVAVLERAIVHLKGCCNVVLTLDYWNEFKKSLIQDKD